MSWFVRLALPIAFSFLAGGQTSPPAPRISPIGLVHRASNLGRLSPSLPRGGIFLIRGAWLGPEDLVLARQPLPTKLAEARIEIRSLENGTIYPVKVIHAWAFQLAGILPLNVPAGIAELTAVYQGWRGKPVEFEVVDSLPEIFAVSQQGFGPGVIQNFVSPTEQPLNSLTKPAKPGQFVILWGTGLGELTTRHDVVVRVGSLALKPSYAGPAPGLPGVDQFNVFLPDQQELPRGCYVPLSVVVNGRSNGGVSITIADTPTSCQHPWALSQDQLFALDRGERLKTLQVAVVDRDALLFRPEQDPEIHHHVFINANVDLANADGVALASRRSTFLTPSRSSFCFSQFGVPLGGLFYAGDFSLPPPADNPPALEADAGELLEFVGPAGQLIELRRQPLADTFADTRFVRPYQATQPGEDDRLVAGTWTLSAPGGADGAAFRTSVDLPLLPPVSPPASIDLSQDLTIDWPADRFSSGDQMRLNISVFVPSEDDGLQLSTPGSGVLG